MELKVLQLLAVLHLLLKVEGKSTTSPLTPQYCYTNISTTGTDTNDTKCHPCEGAIVHCRECYLTDLEVVNCTVCSNDHVPTHGGSACSSTQGNLPFWVPIIIVLFLLLAGAGAGVGVWYCRRQRVNNVSMPRTIPLPDDDKIGSPPSARSNGYVGDPTERGSQSKRQQIAATNYDKVELKDQLPLSIEGKERTEVHYHNSEFSEVNPPSIHNRDERQQGKPCKTKTKTKEAGETSSQHTYTNAAELALEKENRLKANASVFSRSSGSMDNRGSHIYANT